MCYQPCHRELGSACAVQGWEGGGGAGAGRDGDYCGCPCRWPAWTCAKTASSVYQELASFEKRENGERKGVKRGRESNNEVETGEPCEGGFGCSGEDGESLFSSLPSLGCFREEREGTGLWICYAVLNISFASVSLDWINKTAIERFSFLSFPPRPYIGCHFHLSIWLNPNFTFYIKWKDPPPPRNGELVKGREGDR